MKFQAIQIRKLINIINQSNTSEKKKEYLLKQLHLQFMKQLNHKMMSNDRRTTYNLATDKKYTVITDGTKIGIAKRTTYKPKKDKYNFNTGIIIALFRMLKS